MVKQDCVQADRVRSIELDNAILKTNYATMTTSINRIETKIDKFIDSADKRYVTKDELQHKLRPIEDRINVNTTAIGKLADWVAKYGPVVAIIGYILFQGAVI